MLLIQGRMNTGVVNKDAYKKEYKSPSRPSYLDKSADMNSKSQMEALLNQDYFPNIKKQIKNIPEEIYPKNFRENENSNFKYDKNMCQLYNLQDEQLKLARQKYGPSSLKKSTHSSSKTSNSQAATTLHVKRMELKPQECSRVSSRNKLDDQSRKEKRYQSLNSPEVPKSPTKKASPIHFNTTQKSSYKPNDMPHDIKTTESVTNQVTTVKIETFSCDPSNEHILVLTPPPPPPPMNINLAEEIAPKSFKKSKKSAEKKPSNRNQPAGFESVLDELKCKLQNIKTKSENDSKLKGKCVDEKRGMPKTQNDIELEIDTLLDKVKHYKVSTNPYTGANNNNPRIEKPALDKAKNSTKTKKTNDLKPKSRSRTQKIPSPKSSDYSLPNSGSDLETKSLIEKVKASKSPCVAKVASAKKASPTKSCSETTIKKPKSVIAMAKYFEENFKPEEIKINKKVETKKSSKCPTSSLKLNTSHDNYAKTKFVEKKVEPFYLHRPKEVKITANKQSPERSRSTAAPLRSTKNYEREQSVVSEVEPFFQHESALNTNNNKNSDIIQRTSIEKKTRKTIKIYRTRPKNATRQQQNVINSDTSRILPPTNYSSASKFVPLNNTLNTSKFVPLNNSLDTSKYASNHYSDARKFLPPNNYPAPNNFLPLNNTLDTSQFLPNNQPDSGRRFFPLNNTLDSSQILPNNRIDARQFLAPNNHFDSRHYLHPNTQTASNLIENIPYSQLNSSNINYNQGLLFRSLSVVPTRQAYYYNGHTNPMYYNSFKNSLYNRAQNLTSDSLYGYRQPSRAENVNDFSNYMNL